MTGPVPAEPASSLPMLGRSASSTVLGRGSLYTVATAGPALAAVAVLPVVTRLLPVAEYDLVAVCLVVVQVGYILVALGMGAAITRQYVLAAGGAAGARGLVLQGVVLSAALTGAAVTAEPVWAPTVLGRPASAEITLALVACLGGAWMVLAQSYLRGADRAGAFVGIAIVAGLLGPVVGLVSVAVGDRAALPYLAGVAGGYVAAGVLGILLVLDGPVAATFAGVRDAMRIGLPTVPHQVSLYVALAGLVVIADRVFDGGGRANVALTLGAGATVVTAALNNAWAPVIYRTPVELRPSVLTETTRTIGVLTVAVAGSVALLGPWVLKVAAPGSYDPQGLVPAVALASAAALPSVVYLASGHLIFAGGRTLGLAATTPLAVGGGLLWAGLLSPRWSMLAVASGYLVTYLLLATVTTALQRSVVAGAWWPPAMPAAGAAWVVVTVGGCLLPVDGGAAWFRILVTAVLLGLAAIAVRRGITPAAAR